MVVSKERTFAVLLVALVCAWAGGCSDDDAGDAPEREGEAEPDSGQADDADDDDDDDEDPPRSRPGDDEDDEDEEDTEAAPSEDDAGEADGEGDCQTFDSSFAAIQKVIFEGKGCTASACHGESVMGGLDLRADVAYENLVDASSTNSAMARVQPGTATDSFLFNKLAAATNPDSVTTTGSPMPVGTAPLTAAELAAVQLWIVKGAPATGAVADEVRGIDVGSLLNACLPPARPVKTKPLEPPAVEEGIQFRLPPYVLEAGSEIEQCTPFAYDFTDRVPAIYKDEARNVIFVNGSRVRQDPQSHHMVVWNPLQDLPAMPGTDPTWTCRGGDHDGELCDANQPHAVCGDVGVCAGAAIPGTLCDLAALPPPGPDGIPQLPSQVANTQSPQEYIPPMAGVYWEIPLHGILWFNSHAFNLTGEDTLLEARMNFFYATELTREMRPVNVIENNGIADGQAPFTRETYCATHVVPQDYSMAILTGHTHRRGERFWVTNAAGEMIYENFVYNDPVYLHFDPWITFNSPVEAERTLEYCATYNNGLTADDKPDLELVTRASRMPDRTSCTPVACVAGKVTEACTVDSDCDSSAGAGDGLCDACPITYGPTTENEMFVLMPWYVLPPAN